MKLDDVKEAEAEARRFLKRVAAYKTEGHGETNYWPSPDRAALTRASLDLTKALAKMRSRS